MKSIEQQKIEAHLRRLEIAKKIKKTQAVSGTVKPQWFNENKLYQKGFWNRK